MLWLDCLLAAVRQSSFKLTKAQIASKSSGLMDDLLSPSADNSSLLKTSEPGQLIWNSCARKRAGLPGFPKAQAVTTLLRKSLKLEQESSPAILMNQG